MLAFILIIRRVIPFARGTVELLTVFSTVVIMVSEHGHIMFATVSARINWLIASHLVPYNRCYENDTLAIDWWVVTFGTAK